MPIDKFLLYPNVSKTQIENDTDMVNDSLFLNTK